jgi:hypothetical protein
MQYPENEDVHTLFLDRFGYPDDLPDLSGHKPPGGNERQNGIYESHFARKQRNALPDVY